MSNKTVTIPGRATVTKTNTKPAQNAAGTVCTTIMDFGRIKHLLSEKPLRSPKRSK
jgi:hypothetical protein